ncbi:MAG: pectinacetylesterase family protein [Myxococcaceae bacterium]|nr:pectinacetylesterase family protein [Myxococcaceae bacterium]
MIAALCSLAACGPQGPGADGSPDGDGGASGAVGGGALGTPCVGGGAGGSTGGGSAGGAGAGGPGGGAGAGGAGGSGGSAAGGGGRAGGGSGASDAGTLPDVGWSFIGVPGSQCALGAQAGVGYNPGAADELVIYLQGGGACWNNGTCHPSLYQWGPICNYGMGSVCLVDTEGSTRPLAVYVSHPNPYPADGGGVFPQDLATIRSSLLFNRRTENPLRNASYVFVPYCTGDLHSGNSTRTYYTRADLFSPNVAVTHHFAGGTNMDKYLAMLRAKHPKVKTIWLTGVSGGGYGASFNLKRVRLAFPEATVHLLADSAPMVDTPYFPAFKNEWNLQLPAGCTACDAGMTPVIEYGINDAPGSRVALLAFSEDAVITRFMYSSGDTGGWLNPPYATYTSHLVALENQYATHANAKYFRLPGQDHVMLGRYGVVLPDGGVSAPAMSPDGGTDLRQWVNAWATGTGPWANQR